MEGYDSSEIMAWCQLVS